MKKLLTFISLCMVIALLLPVVSFAATTERDPETGISYEDYYEYSKTNGYYGPGGDVVVPWTLGGRFVIAVGQATFAACETVTSVEIPREATWIGAAAFSSCEALRSVSFDNNLESIENDAFFGCTSLQNVILPPHIEGIGERTFGRCLSLDRVTMRGGVRTIGKWAFSDCVSLESVTLPDTVELIRRDAFSGCTSLKKVYYAGSEEDWAKITIDKGNDELLSAQIVYGYKEPKFGDVKYTSYFIDPVLWAVENGITKGTSAKTFSPSDPCTRGQIVTFLWRAAGSPAPKNTNCPFKDVTPDKFYYNAVLWAVENGITQGTGKTTFSPSDPCTRGQIVTFLWRAAESPAPKSANCPFSDVTRDKFYYNAVLWAVENGVTEGTSETTFSPASPCTRAQVVTFIYRDHFSGEPEEPADPAEDDGVLDIAFFGNSFVGVPKTFDQFEAIAEGKHEVRAYNMTQGGWTLANHYGLWFKVNQKKQAKELIDKWDVVVLNEGANSAGLVIKEEYGMTDEEFNNIFGNLPEDYYMPSNDYMFFTEMFGKDKTYYNLCQSTMLKTEEGAELSANGLQRHVGNSWVPSNKQCFACRDWLKENCNINRIMVNLTNGFDPEVILDPRDFDYMPADYHPNLMYGYCFALALYCTIFDEPCAEQNNGILTDDDIPGDTPEEKEAYMVMIKNLVQEELDFQNSH